MAVLSVPRPLQDRLGDAATDSLVGMLQQIEADRENHRAAQKEHLFDVLEERFLRHVVESEERVRKELRAEMQAGFTRQQEQISALATEVGELRGEIGGVRAEIGGVRAEIGGVRAEIGSVRADFERQVGELRGEIGSVRAELHKEMAAVRSEITIQTRWILAVLGAAAILFPIIQRVMETLLP